MPPAALRFRSTLRVVHFGCCKFPDVAADQLGFPNPKHLKLRSVTISEDSLRAVLAGCPALNSVMLEFCYGFRRLRITSQSLNCFSLHLYERPVTEILLQEVIVENAPCLERLLHCGSLADHGMRISVISAPTLKMIGRLTGRLGRLELGTTVFQGLQTVRIETVMRTVKVLALGNHDLSLDVVINFLRCFPCLETLHIRTYATGIENKWCHKPLDHIECLDRTLKKLVLCLYNGKKSYVDFAKFFVCNARALELMKLDVELHQAKNKKWTNNQRKLLLPENWASSGARIEFAFYICSSSTKEIHELSDPFECEF